MAAETVSPASRPEWFAAQPWETPGLPWDLRPRPAPIARDDTSAQEDEASPSAA